MAQTESDIAIAVNKVLDGYDVTVHSTSGKMTRLKVIGKDRLEIRADVEKSLKDSGITWKSSDEEYPNGWSPSSFSGTVIKSDKNEKTEFIYKSTQIKQSGGGAALTKLTESAQCVYAAIAAKKGGGITSDDITPENVSAASSKFDVDEKIENILNALPADWHESCIKGANELYSEFGAGFTYERGSKNVKAIDKAFKDMKKVEGVRMDINKWSPADMNLIAPTFDAKCLLEENSFRGLNQCMQERIQKKVCIGVSLKKMVGNAKIVDVNIDKSQKDPDGFARFEFSPKSMDGYVHCKSGAKIQFRGFAGAKLTGWQGEVSGKSAKHGKISLGPINLLIKNHVGGQCQIPTGAARTVTTKREMVEKEIFCGFHKYNPGANDKQVWDTIRGAEPVWLYSKWQVVKLFDVLKKITTPKKRDQLVEDMLLYAQSQSSLSAPYYKMSD